MYRSYTSSSLSRRARRRSRRGVHLMVARICQSLFNTQATLRIGTVVKVGSDHLASSAKFHTSKQSLKLTEQQAFAKVAGTLRKECLQPCYRTKKQPYVESERSLIADEVDSRLLAIMQEMPNMHPQVVAVTLRYVWWQKTGRIRDR